MYNILFQPVKSLIPVKEATAKALLRLGIESVRDLLFYKPYSYKSIAVQPNLTFSLREQEVILTVKILDVEQPRSRKGPLKFFVESQGEDKATLVLVFFNKIAPFIFARLRVGEKVTIAGKLQYFDSCWQITHPEFILKNNIINTIEPIYHLTYGIINKQLYGYIVDAINAFEVSIKARLNFAASLEESSQLIFYNEKQYILDLLNLLKQQHLIGVTGDAREIQEVIDRSGKQLAVFELFANQVSLQQIKLEKGKNRGLSFNIFPQQKQQLLQTLGFELTEGQSEVIQEIEADMNSSSQMMRLLQGDVGSGKTLVALLTMLNVALDSYQSCLMVPTDLLSVQHYNFFKNALEKSDLGINVALLTGKTSAAERRKIYHGLETGEIKMLIGTHALFQEKITFKNLGYVVIDEQHRFGVEQRLELVKKAEHPDILVMTATPIPRSLTLTMFGDMQSSQIRTKPKNRLPIITSTSSIKRKAEIIQSLQKKLEQDERIYWVCPLIDQNDDLLDGEEEDKFTYSNVVSTAAEIDQCYPGQVGILHGKIKAAEKDIIMQKFKAGEFKILVATTVIEVGIDVPEASLIIIENAEKFGLAQLHQLRGRVGRGHLQSYCLLVYDNRRLSAIGKKRLEVMKESSDGFFIAEQDLLLRGGGEILGTRQSGDAQFYFADLNNNLTILQDANKLAKKIQINDFIEFQIKLFARNNRDLMQSG